MDEEIQGFTLFLKKLLSSNGHQAIGLDVKGD
jgi:hypothetical protein